ncbi:RNA-directed DNA polymerase, eukaryota, reverse transcriptase zinc-binding domain protein [Tanacetum coccineum]|uniref:RNA-directed DNA polymerase, eukaryota, reverse transcriptase zinc-binding domain protein n=1 Tax=Tanacetum coccineum TaxID=301880 RepID=A0ABQ5J2Q8_9ASTR
MPSYHINTKENIQSSKIHSPTSEFSIKRGLRQGDPLSPFLFILVMEGLHNAFEEAVGNGLITGVNIKNSTNINVSYLFYADDSSGLKINIHKSNIYGIGVNKDEVLSMASNAGCMAGDIPFNYLGLPIGSNMKSIASWKTLVDRFHMRLSSWKANLSFRLEGPSDSYQSVLVVFGGLNIAVLKALQPCSSSKMALEVIFFPKRPFGYQVIQSLSWSRRSLSTLHFLKFPENSFEVLKLLENNMEVLKILENKLESMKILENKLESLKLQENQPVDVLIPLSIKKFTSESVFARLLKSKDNKF